MTPGTGGKRHPAGETEIWIGADQAVIVDSSADGQDEVHNVDRGSAESSPAFELRTIREIVDRDRLFVFGSPDSPIGFERAYVALTHRPDRIVDTPPPTPAAGTPPPTD
ncbi:MAG: hypothetical protein H0U52_06420 [Chloroflexi bacterium]|nr:hypothetical protein [Chloroflexota bacterium]